MMKDDLFNMLRYNPYTKTDLPILPPDVFWLRLGKYLFDSCQEDACQEHKYSFGLYRDCVPCMGRKDCNKAMAQAAHRMGYRWSNDDQRRTIYSLLRDADLRDKQRREALCRTL